MRVTLLEAVRHLLTVPFASLTYASSTLPSRLYSSHSLPTYNTLLLVPNISLCKSYSSLFQNLSQSLPVYVLPSIPPFGDLALFSLLLTSRFARAPIYFFHECSSLVFDIFVCACQFNAVHFPLVSLSAYSPLDPSLFPLKHSLVSLVLKFLGLHRRFTLLLPPQGDPVWSCLRYPPSVRADLSWFCSFPSLSIEDLPSPANSANSILLMASFEDVCHLHSLFTAIVDVSISQGFDVYYKDHPNPEDRLNFSHPSLQVLDPYVPVESLPISFDLYVSYISQALLSFTPRSISLYQLLHCLYGDFNSSRLDTISCFSQFSQILMPHCMSEYVDIILSHKKSPR